MDEDQEAPVRAQFAQAERDFERLQRCLSGVRSVAHQIAYSQRLAELQEAIAGTKQLQSFNKIEEKANG